MSGIFCIVESTCAQFLSLSHFCEYRNLNYIFHDFLCTTTKISTKRVNLLTKRCWELKTISLNSAWLGDNSVNFRALHRH